MLKIISYLALLIIPTALLITVFVLQGKKSGPTAAPSSSPSDSYVPGPSQSTTSPYTPSASSTLPPSPKWCSSKIFCSGQVLYAVDIANIYPDQKTFVDKPTTKSSLAVLSDFQNISSTTSNSDITTFLQNDFAAEGQELQAAQLSDYSDSPPFLNTITSPLARAFAKVVHTFWPQLTRVTNPSALCHSSDQCESTYIPLNHTFVIPGGRYREQHYWDSFWIVEGLLVSEMRLVVKDTLQNFMDELDNFGYIPEGSRTYYADRSQPPLFIQMLSSYVVATGDKSFLARALALAEIDMKWWDDARSVQVTSPSSGKPFKMYHYNVANSAPRPESYLADYSMANDPNAKPPLGNSQKEDFYAALATSSESGWDLSTRWTTGKGLLSLNVKNIIGPDLNSIIYKNHILLARLYTLISSNKSAVDYHNNAADALKAGILDLLWDPDKLAFYDFDLNTKARTNAFSAATFYPFWSEIIPPQVANNEKSAFGAFASINMVLNRYNGTFPATFINSGFEWDAPNAWPPHQYIILQALRNLPNSIKTKPISTLSLPSQSSFDLIPAKQLGFDESQLPGQPIRIENSVVINSTRTGRAADINANSTPGTVTNGGISTGSNENWSVTLQRELANRYFTSVMCSWHATGGSLPGLDDLPNPTQNNGAGIIYEKFSNLNVNSASQVYNTTQGGFGWTIGVLLWVASIYGQQLIPPSQCPPSLQ